MAAQYKLLDGTHHATALQLYTLHLIHRKSNKLPILKSPSEYTWMCQCGNQVTNNQYCGVQTVVTNVTLKSAVLIHPT